VSAYATVGVGLDTTGPAGGGTFRTPSGRGNMATPSGRFSPPRNAAGRPSGGGRGPGGMVQCKAGVEANLLQLQGSCDTPVGTFGASARAVGAQAECGCTGCFAEAYWAKAGVDYTTPPIGGCGFKVSATVGAEVMAGVGVGAGTQGDFGGRATLGPVGVKAGINIEEFDTGAMADCAIAAVEAIGDAAVATGEFLYDVGATVVNGIGDGLSAAGDFLSDVGGGIVSGIGSLFGGGGGGGGIFGGLFGGGGSSSPGSNVVRVAPTNPGQPGGGQSSVTDRGSNVGFDRGN
jgi:hypothetical protein